MAIFGKKSDLNIVIEPYLSQIDMLKSQIASLEAQNKQLTEALISVNAPVAYREIKADQAAAANAKPLDKEDLRKKELEYEVRQRWLSSLEAPVLTSFDDFEDFLKSRNPPTDQDVESRPLHPNTES